VGFVIQMPYEASEARRDSAEARWRPVPSSPPDGGRRKDSTTTVTDVDAVGTDDLEYLAMVEQTRAQLREQQLYAKVTQEERLNLYAGKCRACS
jgi:hypothetical protein